MPESVALHQDSLESLFPRLIVDALGGAGTTDQHQQHRVNPSVPRIMPYQIQAPKNQNAMPRQPLPRMSFACSVRVVRHPGPHAKYKPTPCSWLLVRIGCRKELEYPHPFKPGRGRRMIGMTGLRVHSGSPRRIVNIPR